LKSIPDYIKEELLSGGEAKSDHSNPGFLDRLQ